MNDNLDQAQTYSETFIFKLFKGKKPPKLATSVNFKLFSTVNLCKEKRT